MADSDSISKTNNYRVTSVIADGRCLFRAIAHIEYLRKSQEAPTNVVQELIKRRKEVEWFIDEEFEMYVKRNMYCICAHIF